jgi:hypothetical protein
MTDVLLSPETVLDFESCDFGCLLQLLMVPWVSSFRLLGRKRIQGKSRVVSPFPALHKAISASRDAHFTARR